jgi:hypothetical protein
MNHKCIDVPQDKEKGGILDELPPPLLNQPSFPQPINKASHRNDEKDMSELMGVNAFDTTVSLSGEGIVGRAQNPNTNSQKENYFGVTIFHSL